jgi:signal transduction histidine kinase/DNA-binding response OmpR family regulator/HAMP domain-containing protein
MELFRKLSIRSKVLICMIWPFLGFLYFCGTNFYSERLRATQAESVKELVEISKQTIKVIDQLQQEREASIDFLVSRSDEDRKTLLNIHQASDVVFRKFRENILPVVDELDESVLKADLQDVERVFESLTTDPALSVGMDNQTYRVRSKVTAGNATLGEVLLSYNKRLSQLIQLMDQFPVHIHLRQSRSKLGAAVALLEYIEWASLEIALYHHTLVGGKYVDIPEIGSDQLFEIKLSLKRQEDALAVFGAYADIELEETLAKALPKAMMNDIQKYRDVASSSQLDSGFQPTPVDWRELNAKRILNSWVLMDRILDDIQKHVQEQQISAKLAVTGALLSMVFFALCLGAGSWVLFKSENRIRHLTEVAETLAVGNLNTEIRKCGYDELGQMSDAFQKMISSLKDRAKVATQVSKGNYGAWVELAGEADELGLALKGMVYKLHIESAKQHRREWVQRGQQELSQIIESVSDLNLFSEEVVEFLCLYLHAEAGVLYVVEEEYYDESRESPDQVLLLSGAYSCDPEDIQRKVIHIGEGLIGECLRSPEIRMLNEISEDYLSISSSMGKMPPKFLLIAPIHLGERVVGVVELAAMRPFSEHTNQFWEAITESLGTSLLSKRDARRTELLLRQTQKQAAALESQQEELQAQTEALGKSKADLESQKHELEATNQELEKNAYKLALQKKDLEVAQSALQQKARELELASRYKSEFLANMSHELRTPLNALLILAHNLSRNKTGNLTEKQVKWADIIHSSGTELLSIINDILDLSKIESGMLEVHPEPAKIADIANNMLVVFEPVASKKGIEFKIQVDANIPEVITTDSLRLSQILRNLIGNALKFTNQGEVCLQVSRIPENTKLHRSKFKIEEGIALAVKDTGVGIPEDRQQAIWEAFQQVDGSTNRKFGGTGLGLSISRELSKMLGGEIQMTSVVGQGSIFTCMIPVEKKDFSSTEPDPVEVAPEGLARALPFRAKVKGNTDNLPFAKPEVLYSQPRNLAINYDHLRISDDRNLVKKGEGYVLIVEDDSAFAEVLYYQIKDYGMKAIHSPIAQEAIDQIRKSPPSAVFLDLNLPDMDGRSVLKIIKEDLDLRHIPVQILSADERGVCTVDMGALGFLQKPVNPDSLSKVLEKMVRYSQGESRKLLFLAQDDEHAEVLTKLFEDKDVKMTRATTVEDACDLLVQETFDCMILDLVLPDGESIEPLTDLNKREGFELPPAIIYTDDEEAAKKEPRLKSLANSFILKGEFLLC